jgi:CBS domain-containing protein
LCIDAVELGGLNQGIDDGGGFAATLGPHEHVVFATNGDAAHGSFGCVVVQLKKPVIQIAAQPLHAVESVANGVDQVRLSRAFALSSERGSPNAYNKNSDLPDQITVSSLITNDVISCDAKENVQRLEQLMTEHQVRHIPITDEGVLYALVNVLDLVRYGMQSAEKEAGQLRDYVSGVV